MSYQYVAYGLTIDSEIELPDLSIPAEPVRDADLTIRIGEVPAWGSADGGDYNNMRWIDPARFWFHANEIAHYSVTDGRTIIVMTADDADPLLVRLYLLGTVFGAVLRQRGLLVLHGNAIRIGKMCVICVGDSGAGKSTLAAAFLQRGFDVIADDVTPVDAQGHAIPGLPRIKLWQDAADSVEISTSGLAQVTANVGKYYVPIRNFDPLSSIPVRSIYLLKPDAVDEISIDPVIGSDKFVVLKQNSYRDEFVDNPEMRGEHLIQCSRLAGQVRLSTIRRPAKGVPLDALVDKILADVRPTES